MSQKQNHQTFLPPQKQAEPLGLELASESGLAMLWPPRKQKVLAVRKQPEPIAPMVPQLQVPANW